MEENRSWGASCSSVTYIPRSLLNPKIHYIFQSPKTGVCTKSNESVPYPTQFLNDHLFCLRLRIPACIFSLNPSSQTPICVYIFTCACHMPCPLHLPLFDHVNKCRGVQIIKLQFVYFFVILVFLPTWVQIFPPAPRSAPPSVGAIPLLYNTKFHPHP
jgi:hypothetical protein